MTRAVLAPALTSVTPNVSTAGAANLSISVAGWGFRSGDIVYLKGANGAVALATGIVSAAALSAVIPASQLTSAGTLSLYVTDPDGVQSHSISFVISPAPTITSISPGPSLTTGSGPLNLGVSGSGFNSACTVQGNGTPLNTTYVNGSQLQAVVPATMTASPGTIIVKVLCGGSSSNSITLTLSSPAPFFQSGSPSSANAGGPAFTLNVQGGNFVPGATIRWSGTALATTFQSATQLNATVPATLTAIAGSYAITVSNPDGSVTSPVSFPVYATLSAVTPNSAPSGSADLTITVTGIGFPPGTAVDFNATVSSPPKTVYLTLQTNYVDSSTLKAVIPAAALAQPGQAVITNQYSSGVLHFTIAGTPLTVTSLSPGSATAGSLAFTLTVSGSGFVSGSSVHWNSTALTTTFVSTSQLTAAVPATLISDPGGASISVANPDGTASAATAYYINAPPATLSSLSPNSAAPGSAAFTLSVSGSQFFKGAQVLWGQSLLPTTVVSPTVVTATVDSSLLTGSALSRSESRTVAAWHRRILCRSRSPAQPGFRPSAQPPLPLDR